MVKKRRIIKRIKRKIHHSDDESPQLKITLGIPVKRLIDLSEVDRPMEPGPPDEFLRYEKNSD